MTSKRSTLSRSCGLIIVARLGHAGKTRIIRTRITDMNHE